MGTTDAGSDGGRDVGAVDRVARRCQIGSITERLAFARTSKGGLSRMSIEFQAFWKPSSASSCWWVPWCWVVTNSFKEIREIYIFAFVLVLESLPFLSAVALAILETSRINSFAFWRQTGIRTAELIGLRPVAIPTVVGSSQPVASEIHREAS